MAFCKPGHVYIVETALTRPPKPKFAICICLNPDTFVWINTKAAPHGLDQLPIATGCHELIRHDSHVDLSRIVVHQDWELEDAREFPMISQELVSEMIALIDAGLGNDVSYPCGKGPSRVGRFVRLMLPAHRRAWEDALS